MGEIVWVLVLNTGSELILGGVFSAHDGAFRHGMLVEPTVWLGKGHPRFEIHALHINTTQPFSEEKVEQTENGNWFSKTRYGDLTN